MTTIKLYRNKRNEHKFIEVRNDGHYHNTVRQFMFWKENGVKNILEIKDFTDGEQAT